LQKAARSVRVLYVEDEPEIRLQMEKYLSLFFGEVVVAEDGLAGWETYTSGMFDIVVSDIAMPRMNGIELCRRIKEQNRDQLIIITSAYSETNDLIELISIGVESFLMKPVDNRNLLTVLQKNVQNILERRELENYRLSLEAALEEKEKALREQYRKDPLTGLYNRSALEEALDSDTTKALVLFDIDNFGSVNDVYGIETGNRVLVEVARRLETKEEKTLFYRLGGNEFACIFENPDSEQVIAFASGLTRFVFDTEMQENHLRDLHLTFSIGIDFGRGSRMISRALTAIEEVRQSGKNRLMVYTPDSPFQKRQQENIFWIDRIRRGIENELFVPYFQPIVENATGRVCKYECLIRYREGETIEAPASFLDAAKQSGYMPRITQLMIRECFRYFQGRKSIFSINITSYDLVDGKLPEYLEMMLERYGIAAEQVVLEVLENISSESYTHFRQQIMQLKKRGFQIAIDDFGSESSNFSRLMEIQADFIKIDGSFIKNLDHDMKSQKIVRAIEQFAHSIGAKLIAEYVHSEAVFEAVKRFNIDFSQGFYLGRPEPVAGKGCTEDETP